MTRIVLFACLAVWWSAPTADARYPLFYQSSSDHSLDRQQSGVFSNAFESRMFKRGEWIGRLVIIFDEPEFDQALELYKRPDGSRYLSYVRATPSLSVILRSALQAKHDDVSKDLAAVSFVRREVPLRADVAAQVEAFWRTILPGAHRKPEPLAGEINLRLTLFVASVRDRGRIEVGEVPLPARNTPAYRCFVDIAEDLLRAVNGDTAERRFARLPSKIRNLQALVEKN